MIAAPVNRIGILVLVLASCGAEDGCNSFGRGFGMGPSFDRRPRGEASVDLSNLYSIDSPAGTTDRMEIADNAALEPTDEFGFFMRFRQDAVVGADALLSKFNETANPDVASFVVDQTSPSAGHTQYRFNLCSESSCATNRVVTTARGPMENGEWTCVGGDFDISDEELHIYVDGANHDVTASGSGTWGWIDTATDWTVGNRHDGGGNRNVDGAFDDVIIWFGAQPSAQCQWDLCNNRGSRTLPATCPALTNATWCRGGDDDSGTGSTCTDYSGNGLDWTLTDSMAFTATDPPVAIATEAASTNNRTRQVVAVLGQSNAGGRGDLAELASSPFVQRFDNSATSWADETGDAADVGGGDVNILFATEEDEVDYIAFGYAAQFNYLNFSSAGSGGVAGIGGTVAWEYWDGDSWAALSNVIDGTLGFTVVRTIANQYVTWTTPGDWATTTLNGSAAYYFIRARVTNVYSTNPIYDWVSGDQDLVWPNRADIFLYDNNGPIATPNGIENPPIEPFDTNAAPFAVYAASFDASAGTFTSAIPGFNSATTADVTFFPATEEDELDYFAVCALGPFDRITWDRTGGTQGADGAIAVEYCSAQTGGSCDTWTAVSSLSDATNGMTAALGNGQVMSWTFPTNWVQISLNNAPSSYCARLRVTTVYSTNPVASRGAFLGQASVFSASDEASTVGWAMQMASDLAATWTSHEIGVVPCPLGGTSSADWLTSHGQTNRLAGECESRIAAANLGSTTADLAAIVIYQGEFEGNQPDLAPLLAERWAATIQGIRDTLDRQVHAVVIVSPSTVPAGQTEWTVVRTEQAAICDLIPHCTVVNAPEGPLAADDTHLTTAANLVLGASVADAILASDYGLLVTP